MAKKQVKIRDWNPATPEPWTPADLIPDIQIPNRPHKRNTNPSNADGAPLMVPKVPKPPMSKKPVEPEIKPDKPTYTADRRRPKQLTPTNIEKVTKTEIWRRTAEPSKRDKKVDSPIANANTPFTQKMADNLAKGEQKKTGTDKPPIKPTAGLGKMVADERKKEEQQKAKQDSLIRDALLGTQKPKPPTTSKKHEQGKGGRGGR